MIIANGPERSRPFDRQFGTGCGGWDATRSLRDELRLRGPARPLQQRVVWRAVPPLGDPGRCRAEEAYGPVECLINNSGFLKIGPLANRDPSELSYEIDVLLKNSDALGQLDIGMSAPDPERHRQIGGSGGLEGRQDSYASPTRCCLVIALASQIGLNRSTSLL
jgi:hypothetical protein